MLRIMDRDVDLVALEHEMVAAGLPIRALGVVNDRLHTYDTSGAAVDLPAGWRAIFNAHVPPVRPNRRAAVLAAIDEATTMSQVKAALRMLAEQVVA